LNRRARRNRNVVAKYGEVLTMGAENSILLATMPATIPGMDTRRTPIGRSIRVPNTRRWRFIVSPSFDLLFTALNGCRQSNLSSWEVVAKQHLAVLCT
jgi:hypothetical protein